MRNYVQILAPVFLITACAQNTGDASDKSKDAVEGRAKDRKDAPKGSSAKDAAAEGKDQPKADAAKAAAKAAEKPKGRTFRKGQMAPPRMTPEEVRAYAEAQGDPEKGDFTLEEAFAGDDALKGEGNLWATFKTTMGDFDCRLFEKKTPGTVANFVGLARGTRPSFNKKADVWETKKFYDGVLFHRVIANFMIQTGDPTGSGTGGPGYVIVDEFDKSLRHSKAGILSMANRGPNTGSSQFFVTVRATTNLDDRHAVFGICPNPKVPVKISKVKTARAPMPDKPVEDVKINTIEFERRK